ncbi:hypothetical protein DL96DRAFT_614675 [Flagelloscypha sp. PMI_526]|nr:hypothetical protein DL96DRAFT_614675 [Flagelloscypha sp. PMI_526]
MANTTKQEQAPRMSLELASLAISSYGRDEEIYPASQGKESTANMLYPSIDQIQTLKRDTTEIQRDTQLENGEEDNEEEEDVGTDAFKSSAIPTAPEGIQGYPFNASREVYHFYTRGGRSHDQPPYNNLPSHSSPEERYLFDTSYGVRSAMTHGRTDGQSHGQSPFNTSLQPQTRREHQVQAHSTGNVKDPWPSYNASTQSRNYLGDSTSSTQPFSASQLSHLYQRSARGSFVRSPAPSDTDAGYSFSGSSSSSEYQTTHWSDVPNRHQFSSPSSSLAAPPLAHSDEDDMQSSSLVAQSESGFSASGSSPSSGYQRHQVASWAYPSPPRAPSPTFSDGDHAQSSSSDEHGPSLSSSPADYSTTTFISSPYETVSWPPGEATLATRSVQEAARRRRKRPPRFRCEFCPTDFTAKHNFENHMNSHRNIRPHKCKMGCGKSFGTAQVLRRHESKCKGLSSL